MYQISVKYIEGTRGKVRKTTGGTDRRTESKPLAPSCETGTGPTKRRDGGEGDNFLLPPPPKVYRGYVFTPVCLSVCLSVSRTSQKAMDVFGQNLVDRFSTRSFQFSK